MEQASNSDILGVSVDIDANAAREALIGQVEAEINRQSNADLSARELSPPEPPSPYGVAPDPSAATMAASGLNAPFAPPDRSAWEQDFLNGLMTAKDPDKILPRIFNAKPEKRPALMDSFYEAAVKQAQAQYEALQQQAAQQHSAQSVMDMTQSSEVPGGLATGDPVAPDLAEAAPSWLSSVPSLLYEDAPRFLPPALRNERHATPRVLSAVPAVIDTGNGVDTGDGYGAGGDGGGAGDDGGFSGPPGGDGGPNDGAAGDGDFSDSPLNEPGVSRWRALRGSVARNFSRSLRDRHFGTNLGYSLMTLGEGAARYYDQVDSGQYVDPEMQTADAARDLAPGIGSLVGMGLGMMTPLGAWGGQLLGQGLGTVVGGAVGADEEKAQATRETTEMLAASTGAAGKALDDFKSQLEGAGVAVAQVQQIVSGVVSTVGPVGENFVGNSAGMVAALGELAPENFAVVGRQFAQSPALFGLGQTFRQGKMTGGDYGALGLVAADEGNAAGLYQDDLAEQNASLSVDPAYQAAARQASAGSDQGTFQGLLNRVDDWFDHFVGGDGDPSTIQQDQSRLGAIRKVDTSAKDADITRNDAVFDTLGALRGSDAVAGAGVASIESGLEDRLLKGGGAAAYAGARPALAASTNTLLANDAAYLTNIQQQIADPANAKIRPQLQVMLSQEQEKQAKDATVLDGIDREAFQQRFTEEEAGYTLSQTRGELSGETARQLQNARNKQAAYLTSVADDPSSPLDPAAKAGLQTRALETRYAARLDVYNQQQEQDDLGLSRATFGLNRAELTGDASDIQSAGADLAAGYAKSISDLNTALSDGSLTVEDRIAKERQLNETQQQQAQAQHSTTLAYYGALTTTAQAGADQAGSLAYLARATGGPNADLTMLNQQIADDASASGDWAKEAQAPGLSTSERATFQKNASAYQAKAEQERISALDYAPDPALQTRLAEAEGHLDRMNRSFIEPGNLADARGAVFSAVSDEIGSLNTRKTQQEKDQGHALDPGQMAEYETRLQGLLTERADIASETDTTFFDKLPSITVGGTSQVGMYLPSPSQTAMMLEGKGFGTLAARTFGFQQDSTYNAVAAQSGGLLDAGHPLTEITPGNQSQAALAQAVKDGFSGSTIHIVLTMPDGSTQRAVGQVQTTNARTSGMGVIPGVGGR